MMCNRSLSWLLIGLISVLLVGCGAPAAPTTVPASEVPPATTTPIPTPSPTPDPSLLLSLRSDNSAEKATAAQTIAATGSYPPGSIEALIECLDDLTRLIPSDKVPVIPPPKYTFSPDETTPSEQCTFALVRIGEPALEPLLAALDSYEKGWHREKIALTLGLMGDPRALPPLINLLEQGSLGEVAIALGRLGGAQAYDALLKTYEQVAGDIGNHRSVVYALGYSQDERFLPILLDLLKHENRSTKLDAIIALGHTQNPAAVPALVELLKDEDLHARWYSCNSLGEIGDPQAIPALEEVLNRTDESSVVTDAATKALEAIRSK